VFTAWLLGGLEMRGIGKMGKGSLGGEVGLG
jgi:hypothetical protein